VDEAISEINGRFLVVSLDLRRTASRRLATPEGAHSLMAGTSRGLLVRWPPIGLGEAPSAHQFNRREHCAGYWVVRSFIERALGHD
jgi:hypothetical protein